MFRIETKFEVSGRDISENQFADSIVSEMIDHAKKEIEAKLRGFVCPEHGEHVKVTIVTESPESFEAHISGCCQKAIDTAEREVVK